MFRRHLVALVRSAHDRRLLLIVLVLTGVNHLGCRPRSAPQTARAKPVARASAREKSTDSPARTAASRKALPETTDDGAAAAARADTASEIDPASASPATTDAPKQSAADSAAVAQAVTSGSDEPSSSAPPHERILLLAPGGPLLVDLILTIDERPFNELLPEFVEEVLSESDENGDGRTHWDELLANPAVRYGQLGNVVAANMDEQRQLVQLYDANRDGYADRDELPRLLTRNSGEARAFSLRSSNYYRNANRLDSPTLRVLDTDGGGNISSAELERAPELLKRFDGDDNDILQLADLLAPTDESPDPLAQRRTNEAATAYSLALVRDWSIVLYTFEELYALGQPLAVANFTEDAALFAELDTNQDGTLVAAEVQQLAQVPPHLTLTAHFGDMTNSENGEQQPRLVLELSALRERMAKATVREFPDRVILGLPDTNLTIALRDEASRINAAEEAEAIVQRFDSDANQYLESSELPPQLAMLYGSFEGIDANADGKIYGPELAASLHRQRRAQRSQIRARAGDDRDGLFTALDQDHDGRLTARELQQSGDRLRNLDANADEAIDPNEIPSSMLLVLGRGDPQADQQLFSIPPLPAAPGESAADWFTAMDVNQDGEVSRREFLGNAALFAAADLDQDGFLSAEESAKLDRAP